MAVLEKQELTPWCHIEICIRETSYGMSSNKCKSNSVYYGDNVVLSSRSYQCYAGFQSLIMILTIMVFMVVFVLCWSKVYVQ